MSEAFQLDAKVNQWYFAPPKMEQNMHFCKNLQNLHNGFEVVADANFVTSSSIYWKE